MSEPFLSQIWYRVADLKPRLRAHVSVHRHRYRGRPWYVLHDHATGRVHRFTPAAYLLIGGLDGTRSIDEVWKDLNARHEIEAPAQDAVIRLLSQLHQNDLIQYESAPDVADLLERHEKQAFQLWKQNLTNPMSFRVPLWDPDRFLRWTLPAVRPLTGWLGLVLWLGLVIAGGAVALSHWQPLTEDLFGRVLATQNLLITLVTYPLLKGLHELAHGYLIRARGGEVHEMGVMFLVLFPVPYVDASAASAFRDKWARAAVAVGGIAIETSVAAIAVMVWVSVEPGIIRAIAYNLILIGGLSTVLVNGNPLLKFDGYYVMSDLVEIPNLATRANKYLGHLVQKRLFGARQMREEVATPGERIWFVLYAPAAWVYRMVIMVGIAIYVAQKFFVIGVLLACWSIFTSVVKPISKGLHHVVTAPVLRKVRRRAMWITFGGAGAVLALAMMVPLPLGTDSEAVVWLPEEAHVRARTSGFVDTIAAETGAPVGERDVIARLSSPALTARIAVLDARVEEARRRVQAADATDRALAQVARVELDEAQAAYDRERARLGRLSLRAGVDGRFQPVAPASDLVRRYIEEGDLIGYVLPGVAREARAVVTQDDIALVRERRNGAEVRLRGRLGESYAVERGRERPSATDTLPSAALGLAAGGRIATDPSDPEGRKVLEQVFLVDLELPGGLADAPFGARLLVRFDHGTEPAAAQVWRRVRQLLLRVFDA